MGQALKIDRREVGIPNSGQRYGVTAAEMEHRIAVERQHNDDDVPVRMPGDPLVYEDHYNKVKDEVNRDSGDNSQDGTDDGSRQN